MIRRLLELLHADPYGNLGSDQTWSRLAKLASPRYLRSKVALIAYESAHPDAPWFTRDAIERLEGWLRPSFRGLEFGSGRSTPWLARRSEWLVSVEHNPGWFAQVARRLAEEGIGNVDHRLVDEADYASVSDGFPDAHFDYVVIDGLQRDETLLRATRLLRPGGWIIFDNANWYLRSPSRTPHSRPPGGPAASPAFERAERVLSSWSLRWTTNGVNDTLLAVKPESEAARPSTAGQGT